MFVDCALFIYTRLIITKNKARPMLQHVARCLMKCPCWVSINYHVIVTAKVVLIAQHAAYFVDITCGQLL